MEFDELLITTGVDALVRLVKEKEKIELELASKLLNIDTSKIEDWARILEEEGIIRIEYRLTKVYLIWVNPTEEEVAKTLAGMQNLRNAIDAKDKDKVQHETEALNEVSRPYAERVMDAALKDAMRGKKIL